MGYLPYPPPARSSFVVVHRRCTPGGTQGPAEKRGSLSFPVTTVHPLLCPDPLTGDVLSRVPPGRLTGRTQLGLRVSGDHTELLVSRPRSAGPTVRAPVPDTGGRNGRPPVLLRARVRGVRILVGSVLVRVCPGSRRH